MASELVPSSVPATPPQRQPLQAWLARLGLSGKLLAVGGLVGVIAVFLPLVSIQMQTPGGAGLFGARGGVNVPAVSMNQTVLVIRDFRGMICLVGYVAALALAYVLYAPAGLNPKTFGWAGAGVGAVVALLALWLVLGTLSGSGSLGGFGGSLQVSVGIGAILNLLAGAAVAAGGFLKVREEKLI